MALLNTKNERKTVIFCLVKEMLFFFVLFYFKTKEKTSTDCNADKMYGSAVISSFRYDVVCKIASTRGLSPNREGERKELVVPDRAVLSSEHVSVGHPKCFLVYSFLSWIHIIKTVHSMDYLVDFSAQEIF